MTQHPRSVFHVDGERGFRGGERQLLYLACALRARGHRNVVACRSGSPLAKAAAALNLETLPLPFYSEWDPLSAWRLRRTAKRSSRPILHAHTAHAAGLCALASCCSTLPWLAHRRVDFPLTAGLSRRLKYQPAGRVVAVSRAIGKILSDSGLPPERIATVPDAIPVTPEECAWAAIAPGRLAPPPPEEKRGLRRELSREFEISENAPWIGNLAALVPHKDHDTLIAAALIVTMKRPETVFLIAGQGPEEGRLLGQIKRMGLLGKVLLLGQREDPVPLLKSLDFFALSSWGEGMGSVLLEAAACGVPIAATSAGGIPEVLEDGQTGLLCPPRDPEALARNLLRLIAEPELALRLAQTARRRLADFSLGRMAERMEEIYARLP